MKVTRNLGAELIMLNAFEIEVDDSITPRKYDQLIKNNWLRAYRQINSNLFISGLKRLKGLHEYLGEISLFASIFNSSVHFLHLSKHARDNEIVEEVTRIVRDFKPPANQILLHHINDRDPGTKLKEYIAENNIGLVSVARQQPHAIGDIYATGFIEAMCTVIGIPLLVLIDVHPV